MTPKESAAAQRSKNNIGHALEFIARNINKEHMATVVIQHRSDPTQVWMFSFEPELTTEQLAEYLEKGLDHIKKEHIAPESHAVIPPASGRN